MHKLQRMICLAPLALSACATAPVQQTPLAGTAGPRAFITQAATFTAAPVPDDWWRLYEDPALNDIVEQALIANLDLRIAAANLERARAVLGEARVGRLPSTTLSGGASYGDAAQGGVQVGGAQARQWSQNATLAVAWEADFFGRIRSAIGAARADADAVEGARDAVRVKVAADTTRAYLGACTAGYALDAARRSLAISARTYQLIELQHQVGSSGRLELERAGAALAGARAAVPQLEAARQVSLFELAALLGRPPQDAPVEASTCAKAPRPLTSMPVGDAAALLKRRPDLRQAERRLAADAARVGVATADLYPKVSLGGAGAFFRNDQARGSESLSFSLGPLVSWSFPNASVARERVRQAKAQEAASLAGFDAAVISALKEVEQAMAAVAGQQQRLDALQEAQERSERAFELADLRYRAGSAAYLEVLAAQSEALAARQAYAASLQQLNSDRVDLFRALGGGWNEIKGQTPAG